MWHAKSVLGGEESQKTDHDRFAFDFPSISRILVGNFQIIASLPATFEASFLRNLPLSKHFFDATKIFQFDFFGLTPIGCIWSDADIIELQSGNSLLFIKFCFWVCVPAALVILIQVRHKL